MSTIEERTSGVFGATLTRSSFVKRGGALVVGVSIVGAGLGAKVAKAAGQNNTLDATQPGSWFEINADNTILMRTGRAELGQGSASTAYVMIAAEELDVPYEAITTVVMADTDRTPDGGISSNYMAAGATNIRKAAAYTRQALLALASERLGVPSVGLSVKDGIVSGGGGSVTYGDLVNGQQLKLTIPVTGDINGLGGMVVTGNPPTKPVSQYRIIGSSIPMRTIPAIVSGTTDSVASFRLPGMLHGRVVHPKTLGSTLVSVGELDRKKFPDVQVVVKGNFVGVVSPREYEAIKAARLLAQTTKWTDWQGLPGDGNLFGALRRADWSTFPVNSRGTGAVDPALASAAKTISATYEWPYSKHAPIGPAIAVADVRSDGMVYVWATTQTAQIVRREIATMLGLPYDKVVVRVLLGSGHYGRSNHGSTGAEEEAVLLSQAVGKPVRLQWMRPDDMQWSHGSWPFFSDVSAGLDADGKIVSYKVNHYAPIWRDERALAALLAGLPANRINLGVSLPLFDTWLYDKVPNTLEQGLSTYQLGQRESPLGVGLRANSMRTPYHREVLFARETMFNELAAAARIDPIQFRINHTSDQRLLGVLEAARTAFGWETRQSPSAKAATSGSEPITGQGCCVMFRYDTYWVWLARVSVVPKTGKVRVTDVTIAADPGIVVNPRQARRMMEGGVIQGVSETLTEQVTFNKGSVTSTDWVTYPILRFKDAPKVKAVLINNPGVGTFGAIGEAGNAVTAAVVGAVFDATGKMPRRRPLRPGYVRELLGT